MVGEQRTIRATEPKPITHAEQRPNQQKLKQPNSGRQLTRKQTTHRPALEHHITPHTHPHTHIRNAGEGGRAGQASAWILRRPAQSAAEGARPRHSREQRGGVRHGGQGMWQWQHAGNNAGKMGAVGLLRGGLQPQSRSREMCSYLACCTRDVLSMSPSFLTCFPSSHS